MSHVFRLATALDCLADSSRSSLQIWLGGQTLMGIELGWAGEKWVGAKGPGIGGGVRGAVVASYHTCVQLALAVSCEPGRTLTPIYSSGSNLATYATLFGLPWLEPIIWVWQRWLYSKCVLFPIVTSHSG